MGFEQYAQQALSQIPQIPQIAPAVQNNYQDIASGISNFAPDVSPYYQDPNSKSYVNPHYVGPNPGYYERFDWETPGTGIQNLQYPASSFDALLASQWTDPSDLSGLGYLENLAGQTGNLAGHAFTAGVDNAGGLTPEAQQAIDFNELLKLNTGRYNNFFDQEAIDYFKQGGIDVNAIQSPEDLQAIDPALKGELFGTLLDTRQRELQRKNQLPPQGIGSALGGFGGLIGPILGGLVGGPIGGALIGGATGAFSAGGGLSPFGALTGALSGAGIGDTIANGITNPFTGTNYTGPIATGGGLPPAGNGPAWVLDHTGNAPVGGIDNPFQFPSIPGIPQIPGGTQDPPTDPTGDFNFPPILIPPGGSPGSDTPQDDSPHTGIPPVVIPPLPGGGGSDIPNLPAGPTNFNVSNEGGLYGGRYVKPQIPGPPGPQDYFNYNTNPFQRFT